MRLGKNLKRLRLNRKMTLRELSEKSGVQIATLSRMENDSMTGTLDSHMNICKALTVSLADFYREIETAHKVVSVRGHEKENKSPVRPGKTAIEMLTTRLADKKMMPLLIKIRKKGNSGREKNKVGTEKFVYLLEGKLRVKIGGDAYKLIKGDSVYFDGSLPHEFRNIGKGEARLLAILSPANI